METQTKENWAFSSKSAEYEVSNLGNARSLKGGRVTRLKRVVGSNGYPVLGMWINGENVQVYIHREVAIAFLEPPPFEGAEVCHYPDDNKLNCAVSNLKWGTREENQNHRLIHETHNRGERQGSHVLTEEDIHKIWKLYGQPDGKRRYARNGEWTIKMISEKLNTKHGTVNNVIFGKTWRWLSERIGITFV